MSQQSAAEFAEHLFATGDDDQLLQFAFNFWTYHGASHPESAEVARLARVAAFRAKSGTDELWQTRSIEASYMTGAWGSLALSIQQYFFRMLSLGEHNAAERILDEMARLADQHRSGPPDVDLLTGIVSERRALLHAERGEWDAAAENYQRALGLCPEGSRRALKVTGGLERSRWLAGGDHQSAAEAFDSLATESKSYPDVHSAAVSNLAAAQAQDRSGSVPFDLV